MSRIATIKLIKSLSKSEKRQFKLLAKKQSGDKSYLDLFDLIDRSHFDNEEIIDRKFKKVHPQASVHNTFAYLLKILTDSLVQSKLKEDSLFQLLHGLLRVNVLNERNLPQEGYKELQKLQRMAAETDEQLVQYLLYRYELNYYSEHNFADHSENYLVETQMKARDVLKDIRKLHEHYSLYELLKYRLLYSGRALSKDDKEKLNNLLLSEMSIVNARVKDNLESRKLHLLFQSYFFMDIGDYRSALKTFYELNHLFEKNIGILKHPPSAYFSALDGILDSLRTIAHFNEMTFYINKLEQLDVPENPEYFRFLVRKTIVIYRLVVFLGHEDAEGALKYIKKLDTDMLRAYHLVDEEKQNEMLFYQALVFFKLKKLKAAQKYIGSITLLGKVDYHSSVYRVSKLLSIIIHYEVKDLEYLDYEIRSYRRALKGKPGLLKTEQLIFKVIKLNPDFNKAAKNEILWKKLQPLFKSIEKDKFEIQLLKYFDFVGWVRNKFGK